MASLNGFFLVALLVLLCLSVSTATTVSFVVEQGAPSDPGLMDMRSLASRTVQRIASHNTAPSTDMQYVHIAFNHKRRSPAQTYKTLASFSNAVHQMPLGVRRGEPECRSTLLSAIAAAMQSSDANSHIFVFTNSFESDTQLLPVVRHLAARKNIHVHAILSTSCKGSTKLGDVAKLSEGNLMHVVRADENHMAHYLSSSILDMPAKLLVRKEKAMDRGQRDETYFAVDSSISTLSIMVSCNGKTVPIINLTPPNHRNYSSTRYAHLQSAVFIHRKNPSRGQWRLVVGAKEREVCITTISGQDRAASGARTPGVVSRPAPRLATPKLITLDPEWGLRLNTPPSRVLKQPRQGRYNLLLLPVELAKQVRSVDIVGPANQKLVSLYRQRKTAKRSNGEEAAAFGYYPSRGYAYDVTLRVTGVTAEARPFTVSHVIPAPRSSTTPPPRVAEVTEAPRPVAATEGPPLEETIFRPEMPAILPQPEIRGPDMSSLLDLVGSMEKELSELRAQLEHVQQEKSKREEQCRGTTKTAMELTSFVRSMIAKRNSQRGL